MKRLIPVALVAIAAVAAIVVTGCGGSSSSPSSATAASSSSTPVTIKTASGKHGTYLVDGRGRTLYLFEADKQNKSTCSGACPSIWPPFTANGKQPTVQGGVAAGKVGMTKTPDGASIVTYNGHPLYFYSGDQKPGDTLGQGLNQFGAKWYVLNRAGSKIDDD